MSDPSEVIHEDVSLTEEVDASTEGRPAKGPDPEVWGSEEERLAYDIERGKVTEDDLVNELIAEKLANGEEPIIESEDGTVVKGPAIDR